MAKKTNVRAGTPQSLDLAFNWVKDVLINQSHMADILDGKATTLFSVATVILGIAISAGVLSAKEVHLGSIIFGGLALVSYGWVIAFTFGAIKLRRYETLDNPIEIRKWYWDMSPVKFKTELLSHLEDSYTNNERNLAGKANATRWLIVATAAEVLCLVASLAFTFGS